MNAAFSEEMSAQAWKSQSIQPTVSGQTSVSAPAGVLQTGAVPVSTSIRAPVYGSHLSSHTDPRWQPPTVPQSGLPPPGGSSDLVVPSSPWISIRPLSSGVVVSSASPTPQDSPGANVSTVPSTSSSATAAASETNQTSGLAAMTAGIGSQLPAMTGQSGIARNSGSGSVLPGPSGGVTGNSESSAAPAPPGIAPMSNLVAGSSHITLSGPVSTAQISAPAGPHGTSLHFGQRPPSEATIQPSRPILSPAASPASSSTPGAGMTTVNSNLQLPQYTPYINVPPVPAPVSPWMFPSQTGGQIPARPIPAFTIPNPYLPSIRPMVPLQASIVNKLASDSTGPLAPPGELAISSKSSSTDVDKMSFPSSVSEQDMNIYATLSSITDIEKNLINSTINMHHLKDDTADSWTAHKTSEGIIYYYNSNTGESTYEKPPGFHAEVDKVAAQPTPVSCEMIGGTGWALVTTNDAKKYYYHTITQATSWQVPMEVLEYRKKTAEDVSAKPNISKGNSEKGAISFNLNVTGGSTVLREGQKVTGQAASSALDLIKKKLQDSGASENSGDGNSKNSGDGNSNRLLDLESVKDKAKDSNAEKSSSESSSDSDEEEQGPTKDERIGQFKEMLKEKGIAPFSKWEKELPKILFDPRFKAIPSHTERRSIFEHYVRTRAEEERKERRAAQKAAIEGFKQLLDEASKDINHNTDYDKFAKLWAIDPRFEALDRKERETLLNERILPLRKAEEERVRSIREAAAAGFKTMLKEMGEITCSSRWSRVKDKLRNDHRYRSVNRDEREYLFNSYVAELKAVEQEAERKAKAKREEEEKLKERERELRKRKERDEQELEKIRAKVRKREAVTAYQALLTEKIKDPEASWTESKPKLEKDGLGRATNPELDASEREKLFREHVQSLFERCAREYKNLLAETLTAEAAKKQNEDGRTILNSWSEAKRLIKSDPRYSKMPRRDRESWWRRYADDMQHKLKLLSAKDEKNSSSDAGKSGAVDVSKQNSSYR